MPAPLLRLALFPATLVFGSLAFAQTTAAPADTSRTPAEKQARALSAEEVDAAVADEIATRFNGDRSTFLSHLRQQGKTVREYRQQLEDTIRQREPQARPVANATPEDKVHLRLIQLSRQPNETDETLRARGAELLSKFKAGESFSALASQYSEDLKRAKGGDWGWVKRSDLKPNFSEAAFQLKAGEASSPIVVAEGCFLLFVEDRQ